MYTCDSMDRHAACEISDQLFPVQKVDDLKDTQKILEQSVKQIDTSASKASLVTLNDKEEKKQASQN